MSDRGLRGSARGAKLEKQKNERVDKNWRFPFPPPPSPNVRTTRVHSRGGKPLTERGPIGRSRGSRGPNHGFESQECQSRGLYKAARTDKCVSGPERPGGSLVQVCASQSPARCDLEDCTTPPKQTSAGVV